MSLKQRRARRSEEKSASNEVPVFRHASGYADLARLLGDHTLDADAEPVVPQGYRARSVAKLETHG
jgi:hypothetical protein